MTKEIKFTGVLVHHSSHGYVVFNRDFYATYNITNKQSFSRLLRRACDSIWGWRLATQPTLNQFHGTLLEHEDLGEAIFSDEFLCNTAIGMYGITRLLEGSFKKYAGWSVIGG